jgi:hypothetical protein
MRGSSPGDKTSRKETTPPSDLQDSVFEGSQKQQKNVQYLNYFGRMKTNDAGCTLEFKSRIAIGKAAIIRK